MRPLLSIILFAVLAAPACGGGGASKEAPSATAPASVASTVARTAMPSATMPIATATLPVARAATATASPTIAAVPTSDNVEGRAAVAALFRALMAQFYVGGLAGNAPGPAADPTLASYLPPLPPGFTLSRDFTERSYGWTEDNATVEVAGNIAQAADPSEPSGVVGRLLTLVFRPEDRQAAARFRVATAAVSEQDVREAIGTQSRDFKFSVLSLRSLPATDLGDGSVGFEMAVNTDDTSAQPYGALAMLNTYRVYIFSRGAYIGGVVRIGYVAPIPESVDDLGLAKIIDDKLKGAP